jgi:cysteine synthase A
MDSLADIGNTSLVTLKQIVPAGSARVLVKMESDNPTGSMKDRVAKAMVEAALKDGRLSPGDTVVEYTGGSTGSSLAFVASELGLKAHLISSDAFSAEKLALMRAHGAELTVIPHHGKGITGELTQAMIAEAKRLAQTPGHWLCDQLNNRDAESGYHPIGDELWEQSGHRVDAFVQSVGSAHSLQGTAAALRRHAPKIRIIAAEPAESAVLSGKPRGTHQIEGIGIGFLPPLWRPEGVDEILTASSAEAMAMGRRLRDEEGLWLGTSTGLNVIAALEMARRLGPEATVATIGIDSGLKYLSTELYSGN